MKKTMLALTLFLSPALLAQSVGLSAKTSKIKVQSQSSSSQSTAPRPTPQPVPILIGHPAPPVSNPYSSNSSNLSDAKTAPKVGGYPATSQNIVYQNGAAVYMSFSFSGASRSAIVAAIQQQYGPPTSGASLGSSMQRWTVGPNVIQISGDGTPGLVIASQAYLTNHQ